MVLVKEVIFSRLEVIYMNLCSDAQGSSLGTEMTLGEWRSQQGANQIHIYYFQTVDLKLFC